MTVELLFILSLLVCFQVKHLISDYPLQNKFMLGKFKDKDWVKPLSAHAGVHAGGTFIIALLFTTNPLFSLSLAFLDFIIHFVVDRIKAKAPFKMDDPKFWWALGADQMMHHLTHYLLIALIILSL